MSNMTLQKLASIYPPTLEDESLLKEMFDMRARVSSYFALTSLVDIKTKWQEEIVQKYVDEKRETMAPENPAELSPEDEAQLDANKITKEKELELQAKLDKKNGKVQEEEFAAPEAETPVEILSDEHIEVSLGDEIEITELEGSGTIDKEGNSTSTEPKVISKKKVKGKKR